MRFILLTLLSPLLLLTGCATSELSSSGANANTPARAEAAQAQAPAAVSNSTSDSLNINAAPASNAAAQRRIIRDATLTVELDDPLAAARRVVALAEESGGFVTSNEATRAGDPDISQSSNLVTVNVIIRIPAERFNAALEQIHGLGGRIKAEKVTGQDVTEEYVDLEARIRAKQALETQFLEIMKSARTVEDALAVQRQLGDVRTEIEQLEGRRRYLENRITLSTINVTLAPPTPLLTTRPGGFLHDLARAFGSGLDAAATVFLVLIRVLLALLPFALLILLPLTLLWRYLKRRTARKDAAASLLADVTPHER